MKALRQRAEEVLFAAKTRRGASADIRAALDDLIRQARARLPLVEAAAFESFITQELAHLEQSARPRGLGGIFANARRTTAVHAPTAAGVETLRCSQCGAAREGEAVRVCQYCGAALFNPESS